MSKQAINACTLREAAVEYAARLPLLQELARNLEDEALSALEDVSGVNLVSFRVKAPDSFARKSVAIRDGVPRYKIPLADVEDQIAGRILVSFARNSSIVVGRLLEEFSLVKHDEHGELVLVIPPHVLPVQWPTLEFPPTTFEMQVRHAGVEPDNEISYRVNEPLMEEDVNDLRVAPRVPSSRTVPHIKPRRAKVFVSYAALDARHRDLLDTHLSTLRREGLIDVWHNQQVAPGDDWRATVGTALKEADIILLLISADFIHSDFCFEVELAHAIQRHHEGTARVIPIAVRRTDWGNLPFAHLQALPRNGMPIAQCTDHDEAWAEVAQEIRQITMQLCEACG